MQLFRWFVDLQRQRNRLQDEMTEHFVGNSENARESFGKAAKAMRALPLAKLRVGHILVDRTLLKFLLLELQKAGEHISDLEIPLLSPVIIDLDDKGEPRKKRAKLNDDGTQKQTRNRRKGNDDAEQTARFWSHFPNARGLLKGRKGARLDRSIRTDHLLSATHRSRSARKHEGIEGDEDAGELLRSGARKSTSNGSQTWSTACGDRSWTERYGLLLRQDGRGTRNAVDLHFFDFQILSLIAVLRHLDTAACERGQASSYCDGYH